MPNKLKVQQQLTAAALLFQKAAEEQTQQRKGGNPDSIACGDLAVMVAGDDGAGDSHDGDDDG